MFPKLIPCSLMMALAASPAAVLAGSGPDGAPDGRKSFEVAQAETAPAPAAGGTAEGQSAPLAPPSDAMPAPAMPVPAEDSSMSFEVEPGARPNSLQDILNDPIFQQTVTLDFKGADLQNVIRLVAAKTGLNILLDPGEVQGEITLHLEDVPLGTALDSILRVQRLAYVIEPGNILRIVPEAKVGREEVETKTEVIELNWRDAVDIAKTFAPFLTAHGRMQAEPESQSVIITDVPPNIIRMTELIGRVDRPDRQVLIEARLIDLQENAGKTLAADWSAARVNKDLLPSNSDFGQGNPLFLGTRDIIGPLTNPDGTFQRDDLGNVIFDVIDTENVFADSATDILGTIGGVDPVALEGVSFAGGIGTLQFGSTIGVFGEDYNLNATLRALENRNLVEILANPRVTTLNNVPAQIKIIQEVPYIEGAVSGPGGNTVLTIQYEQIGETIGIKPIITPDKHIRMDIDLKQSIFRGRVGVRLDSAGLEPPLLDRREAKSTVIVQDGDTAVLGGLRKRESRDTTSAVPWLGRIPFIGWAFKNKTYDQTRTETVLMVTPKIFDAQVLVDREKELYDRIDLKWHLPDYMNDETRTEGDLDRG